MCQLVVSEVMMEYRWREEYDTSLASSASVFYHTDVSGLKPAVTKARGSEVDSIFDQFSKRHDPELSATADAILQNLWTKGDVSRQQQLAMSDFSERERSNDQDITGENEHSSALRRTDERAEGMNISTAQQGVTENLALEKLGGSKTAWVMSTAFTGKPRQLLQSEAARQKLARIQAAMLHNLKQSMWLNAFEPLSMSCPLLGRRIPVEAVSEWAAAAFDCDGLGFSWSCLQV
jgi:hypothetical protein